MADRQRENTTGWNWFHNTLVKDFFWGFFIRALFNFYSRPAALGVQCDIFTIKNPQTCLPKHHPSLYNFVDIKSNYSLFPSDSSIFNKVLLPHLESTFENNIIILDSIQIKSESKFSIWISFFEKKICNRSCQFDVWPWIAKSYQSPINTAVILINCSVVFHILRFA